ncbi:MAG: ABC transporter permease [Chloroflexi bacterium]|nr:ABC transporter permease [Chloroflexota bacterium]
MSQLRRLVFWFYALLIYGFLFLPMVVIALFAFGRGDNPTRWPPDLLSLQWFEAILRDEAMLKALRNSFIVGLVAVSIAALLGTAAAFAIHRYRFRGSAIFYGLTMLPAFVPGLVLGIALLIFFSSLDVELSMLTVIIAHVTFLTPVILSAVLSRLERLSPSYEQASRDLGANAWQTFGLVTLPNLRTTLIGALLFAFTLSFDNIVLTFFVTSFEKTLPLEFWGRLRFGLTPVTNALATIMVVFSIVLILAANRFMNAE